MAVEGWQNRSLDDLAHYYNGRAFKPSDWSTQGLPIVRIAQITNPKAELDYYPGNDVEEKHLIDNDDLIFSWSATLTAVKWNRGPAILNQHLFKVVEKMGIDRDYLRHLILNSIEALAGHSHGSTMKHIKRGVLKDFRVDVPPFYEQKKIAEILGSVDEAIAKTEAVISQTQKVKQGLLQTLLTKGIGHTKFKQTEIGEIPASWQVSTLADSLSLLKDGTHLPPKRVDQGPLLLSIQNMIDETLKRTDRDTRVTLEFYQQMHKNWKILPGDVLLACVGATIGKTARVPEQFEPFTLQRSVAVLRAKKDITINDFVYIFLHSPLFYSQMWSRAKVGAQPGIYLKEIGKIQMPIPPLAEQEKIFSIAKSIVGSCSSNDENLLALNSIKSGLMSDLLTGRVRVKLDKKSEKAA